MKQELYDAGAQALLKALSGAKKIPYDKYIDQVSAGDYWLQIGKPPDSVRISISEDELARVKKDKFKALYIPEIVENDIVYMAMPNFLKKVKVRP